MYLLSASKLLEGIYYSLLWDNPIVMPKLAYTSQALDTLREQSNLVPSLPEPMWKRQRPLRD